MRPRDAPDTAEPGATRPRRWQFSRVTDGSPTPPPDPGPYSCQLQLLRVSPLAARWPGRCSQSLLSALWGVRPVLRAPVPSAPLRASGQRRSATADGTRPDCRVTLDCRSRRAPSAEPRAGRPGAVARVRRPLSSPPLPTPHSRPPRRCVAWRWEAALPRLAGLSVFSLENDE